MKFGEGVGFFLFLEPAGLNSREIFFLLFLIRDLSHIAYIGAFSGVQDPLDQLSSEIDPLYLLYELFQPKHGTPCILLI